MEKLVIPKLALVLLTLTILTFGGVAGSSDWVPAIAYDYTKLYEKVSPSVFKIEVDSGHGSGFLVDSRGLIATNYHVIRNTRYLAVKVSESLTVPAEIIVLNSRYDLGIVKVHEKFVEGIDPLPVLSHDREDTIREGMPVVAFGSPLSTNSIATQGIISKVEDASMFGDFLIKPGNSGGPVVNLNGEVVGVNTYGLDDIAGAVRSGFLHKIINELETDEVDTVLVSDSPLRRLPEKRYPTETLKERILDPLKKGPIQYGTPKFRVLIVTPVIIGQLQTEDQLKQAENRYKRRGRKIHDKSYHAVDEMFYEWHRDAAAELEMAVTVNVEPKQTETWGSILAAGIAGGLGAYGVTPKAYKFKGEFYDLRIYRDGEEIEPVRPGRRLVEAALKVPMVSFIDEAYAGKYRYHPADFMTGSSFEFNIYNAKNPEIPHHTKVFLSGSDTIRKIRADFKGVLPVERADEFAGGNTVR